MDYEFVEIGCSDFDTLIQSMVLSENERGLSIEPISFYLEKLPEKENVKKLCYAIGPTADSLEVWYISSDKIASLNLPWWIRGCNSIGKPHITVSNYLKNIGKSDDEFTRETVKIITPTQLIDENNIKSINHLKIDTEGMDCVILNAFLDDGRILPERITFESNVLTTEIEQAKVMRRLIFLGYEIISSDGNNTVAEIRKEPLIFGDATIVSFIYDLGNDMERFFSHTNSFFAIDIPSVIFTEIKYLSRLKRKRNAMIIPMLFSEWDSFKHHDNAQKAFQNKMLSFNRIIPEKYTAQYSIMTWIKFDAIDYVIRTNPFQSKKFVWFDFGLFHIQHSKNPYSIRNLIKSTSNKIRLLKIFPYPNLDHRVNQCTQIAGGFISGYMDYWKIFIERFRIARDLNVEDGYASLEEQILSDVKLDDICEFNYGYYDEILTLKPGPATNFEYIFRIFLNPNIKERDEIFRHLDQGIEFMPIDVLKIYLGLKYDYFKTEELKNELSVL